MKTKHTPGPWRSSIGGIQMFGIYGPPPDGLMIATTDTSVFRPEVCEANARLIAAAPELLEASRRAETIVDAVADLRPEDIGRSFAQAVANELDAAITKAEKGASADSPAHVEQRRTFRIEIDLENVQGTAELVRLLHVITHNIVAHDGWHQRLDKFDQMLISDANGNTCGRAWVS